MAVIAMDGYVDAGQAIRMGWDFDVKDDRSDGGVEMHFTWSFWGSGSRFD